MRMFLIVCALFGLATPAAAVTSLWDWSYLQSRSVVSFHGTFAANTTANPDGSFTISPTRLPTGVVTTATFSNVAIVGFSCYANASLSCADTFNPTGGAGTSMGFLLANGDELRIRWFPGPSGFTGNRWVDLFNSPIGGAGFGPGLLTFSPNRAGAVPEPASWAMMIAGFGLVGAMARRRRYAIAA